MGNLAETHNICCNWIQFLTTYINCIQYITKESCDLDSVVPYRGVKTRFSPALFFVWLSGWHWDNEASGDSPCICHSKDDSKL